MQPPPIQTPPDASAAVETALLETLRNQEMAAVGFWPFVFVLGLSVLAALFVAFLYTRLYGGRSSGSEIHRAFPLLGLSITAIFVCIQFSLPLSLGLLGALSIVRFRTPIKEPEEIGFVMLVIATSLSCATFSFLFLGAILGVAVLALLLKDAAPPIFRRRGRHGLVILTFGDEDYTARRVEIFELLGRELPRGELESLSRADGQVVVNFAFRRLAPARVPEVEAALRDGLTPLDATVICGASTVG